MVLLRELHQAQVFRLLAQDLAACSRSSGSPTTSRRSPTWSCRSRSRLPGTSCRRHANGPPRFAVIAYGKLGGKELGYASDLDIVFLYDDPHEQAPEVYARLAMRLQSWITTRTSAGVLFETDLQLRPSGHLGAHGFAGRSFRALPGARRLGLEWHRGADARAFLCRRAFDRRRVRGHPGADSAPAAQCRRVTKATAEMRAKLHAAHPNRSGLFDVKHDSGGMIDVEFAVQFLVLGHAHEHPQLTGNLGNIALLGIAAGLGLISAGSPSARATPTASSAACSTRCG